MKGQRGKGGGGIVPEETLVADHYYVEDFEDGTLTSSTGRIDRHPLHVSPAVTSKWAKQSGGPSGDEAQNLVAMNLRGREGGAMPEMDERGAEGGGSSRSYVAAPLSHGSNPNSNMAGPQQKAYNVVPEGGQGADLRASEADISLALSAENGQSHDRVTMIAAAGVRRLMPIECERLQALPDGWTDFGADSKRYAALGDAVTASVGEWIGGRIAAVS